eukprot:39930-Pleurochrysis_carterae.AAC.1
MAEWARGVVWDCTDPDDCTPVRRSNRHTEFPGRRQINRAALRAAAAEMRWHDEDIVDQAVEGGAWKCARRRSSSPSCPSTTQGCSRKPRRQPRR